VLWSLESFGDPAAQQPVSAETEITALFVAAAEAEATGGTVSGSAGCNRYSAGYEQEGRQLTLGPAITSLMACETGMEAEQAFLAALESVERYQTLGDQLRLFYDDGQQVMTFRADHTPLQETYWQLTA
jgi:heat shock protein HslJ